MKRLSLLLVICCASLAAQEHAESSNEPPMTWKVANFLILAIGLGYAMGKTLPGVFRSRTTEIQAGIAEAQKIKADAERRAAEVEKRVSALGADIEKFRLQARAEMEKEGERIRQETIVAVEKLEEHARTEIESAGKAARRELKVYAANLALDLAEQRIRTRLDANAEGALVDNFVVDLKRQESKN